MKESSKRDNELGQREIEEERNPERRKGEDEPFATAAPRAQRKDGEEKMNDEIRAEQTFHRRRRHSRPVPTGGDNSLYPRRRGRRRA